MAVILFSPLSYIHKFDVLNAPNREESYDLLLEVSDVVDGRITLSVTMSPYTQTFNLVLNHSQLANYQIQSAPNLAWIGMAEAYLFKEFGGREELETICKWFGIKYVFLDGNLNLDWLYDTAAFEDVGNYDRFRLLRFNFPTSHISMRNRRRILMIGNFYAYENIFWTLIHAGFNPETEALVWDNKLADWHTVEELKEFDLVILYGYSYRSREKMIEVLENYVENGGRLLIETGYSPDSEAEELTSPFPVLRTVAGDFGFDWWFTTNSSIVRGVNFTAFPPPRYGEAPWGISYSHNLPLQPWAETLLWLKGHPIIVAGEYGSGRVVWCGLNLPYHAKSYRNREEARLLLRLLDWLSPPSEASSYPLEVERPIPEKIILSIGGETERGVFVFVRETHFPKWRAYLEFQDEKRELKVYYSGPGFMLVILPYDVEPPARIGLRYGVTRIEHAGYLITLCAITLLMLYAAKDVMRRGGSTPSHNSP